MKVSAGSLDSLEQRVESLQERVSDYEVAESYFGIIQAGERAIWTAILTVLVAGVGFYSYRTFVSEVEDVRDNYEEIRDEMEEFRDRSYRSEASIARSYANRFSSNGSHGKALKNRCAVLSNISELKEIDELTMEKMKDELEYAELELRDLKNSDVKISYRDYSGSKDDLNKAIDNTDGSIKEELIRLHNNVQKLDTISEE